MGAVGRNLRYWVKNRWIGSPGGILFACFLEGGESTEESPMEWMRVGKGQVAEMGLLKKKNLHFLGEGSIP